jgi:hypothetical protein
MLATWPANRDWTCQASRSTSCNGAMVEAKTQRFASVRPAHRPAKSNSNAETEPG